MYLTRVFKKLNEKRMKLLNFTLQFQVKNPHGNSNVKNDNYNKQKYDIQQQMRHKNMKIKIEKDQK